MIAIAAVIIPAALPAFAQSRGSTPTLRMVVRNLLAAERIDREHISLVIHSRNEGKYLYRWRAKEPMIAASNIKLPITFAALRELSPEFRWRTTFRLIEQHDAAGGEVRQGLFVRGSGDPTLTIEDMNVLARRLRTRGIDRLDGGLYFDAGLFLTDSVVNSPSSGKSWRAPVNAYIVGGNTVEFTLHPLPELKDVRIFTSLPPEAVRVISHLSMNSSGSSHIAIEQSWSERRIVFTLRGNLNPSTKTHWVSTAVNDPVGYYFILLRTALQRAGIGGDMILRPLPDPAPPARRIYTHDSRPLRALLEQINKDSNNVAAGALVRTLALGRKPRGIRPEDGLAVIRERIRSDFGNLNNQLVLADGSGLSRGNRVSAQFMVTLLNRVRTHREFAPEFISSLSITGWDGTLRYRDFPNRLRGRVRAKTGSLKGVQNISGYLRTLGDVITFSILINNVDRRTSALQASQQRILTGIYDYLLQRYAPPPSEKPRLPPAATAQAPPASLK